MSPPPIVAALRKHTRAAHDRLEARLDITACLADPAGRAAMVSRFAGLHEGAGRALDPLLARVHDLDIAARDRRPVLRRDMINLGLDPTTVPPCPFPTPASVAEALGFLYVLEGSTLGGRVIAREMASAGRSMIGLRFLDPYGAAAGEAWRSLTGILQREADRDRESGERDIVRGGLAGFEISEAWLCGDVRQLKG